jgi:hypothetical protein
MTVHTAKATIVLVLTVGGIFWWLHSGADLLRENTGFEAFLQTHRGHALFSAHSLVLWFVVLSTVLYPPIIWFCVCMTALDPRMARELIFSRGSLVAWFAPVTFTLFVGFILTLRVVASLAAWLWFLGSIVFIVTLVVCGVAGSIFRRR